MPGTIRFETLDSRVLRDNPMGDPTVRSFPVYLPPGYDQSATRYPVVYILEGFSGLAAAVENVSLWGEPLSKRLDRLIESGSCPPFIAVVPECATRLGGSQFVNSSATGRYEDYVIDEVVPLIDDRFRTRAEAGARGVMGRSSGGYGALVLSMRHPEVFGALASHAGDSAFEYCYLPDIPKAIAAFGTPPDVPGFIERFLAAPKKSSRDFPAINLLAMASCYSPNPDAEWGYDLPFDTYTGALRSEVWSRWLQQDPVRMVDRYADSLRSARLVYFDCGRRDNFNIHLGARQLSRRLTELEVEHLYEEFDDDHFGIVYRYDSSLPLLVAALSE